MKEIEFKFYLNGVETKKENIDWNRSASVRVKNGDEMHVKYMSYLLDKDPITLTPDKYNPFDYNAWLREISNYPIEWIKDTTEDKVLPKRGMSTRFKSATEYPGGVLGFQEEVGSPATPCTVDGCINEALQKSYNEAIKPFAFVVEQKDKDKVNIPAGSFLVDEAGQWEKKKPRLDYDAINREFGTKETDGKLFYELDFKFIQQMAERMQSNKQNSKYDIWNWKKPMTPKGIEDLKQAMWRHIMAVMCGEFEDDGREFGHLEAISNNAMMINYQLKNNSNKNE